MEIVAPIVDQPIFFNHLEQLGRHHHHFFDPMKLIVFMSKGKYS